MAEMMIALDGVRGEVKLTITQQNDDRILKFKWYKTEDGDTGFVSNVTQSPIPVTELAAEAMIKLVAVAMVKTFSLGPESIKVVNHLGDPLQEIEFMPPTFDGKEADIQKFVAKQDALKNLYLSYEEDYQLTSDLLAECESYDVLDDFLCLVQFQLSKVTFTLSNPKE